MKNIFNCLLLFFISHVTFSQEPIDKNNLEKSKVFKFYPNPVEDELFVLGVHKIKSIELINVLGKRVALFQFNKSIIKLNISEIKSGLYLILVTDQYDKQESKKLIIK